MGYFHRLVSCVRAASLGSVQVGVYKTQLSQRQGSVCQHGGRGEKGPTVFTVFDSETEGSGLRVQMTVDPFDILEQDAP